MLGLPETHPIFEAFKIAPRVLTQPQNVLIEQKVRQELKVIKEANKFFEQHNESERSSLTRISSKAQEEVYKKN